MSKTNKGEFVSQSGLQTLTTGSHLTKVTKIADAVSESHGTPQMVVTVEAVNPDGSPNGKGSVRAWFNLKGYLKDDNGDHVLDDDGNLQDSEENTEACMNIIGQFANRCGIPAGKSFDRSDLIGKQVGAIVAINPKSKNKSEFVKSWVGFDRLATKLEATEEVGEGYQS